jgi:hypothetical protein
MGLDNRGEVLGVSPFISAFFLMDPAATVGEIWRDEVPVPTVDLGFRRLFLSNALSLTAP